MCVQLMCLLKHRSRPVSISEMDDEFSTNFTFKLMSWPMGTRKSFRRAWGKPTKDPHMGKGPPIWRKKAPNWRKRPPISL